MSLSKFGQYLPSDSWRDTFNLRKMVVIVTHSRQTCLLVDVISESEICTMQTTDNDIQEMNYIALFSFGS